MYAVKKCRHMKVQSPVKERGKTRSNIHTHKNIRYGNYQCDCIETVLTLLKKRNGELEKFLEFGNHKK